MRLSLLLLPCLGCTAVIGEGGGAPAPDPLPDPADRPMVMGKEDCPAVPAGPRQIRRLARAEYDTSVSALLGVASTAGASLVPDNVVDGFDNQAQALSVSALLADQLRVAAEGFAAQAARDLARHVPCALPPIDAEGCARAFLADFGRRAFRRPLSPAETERYLRLFHLAAGEDGFAAGIELLITTLLQSPGFLYRTELGAYQDGRWRLDPYEVAAELAFLLTGSPPDQPLLAAAESGALSTTPELEAQAARLLQASTPQVQRFVRAWLRIDLLPSVGKDPARFPELDPALRRAMLAETDHFVAEVHRSQGGLRALLTADTTWLDPALAAFYGAPPGGAAPYRWPDGQHAGLLTQGSVLTVHARPDSSSPVHRGKLVRERLLCQPLPAPPPGLAVQPPPLDPTLNGRERYRAHSENEPCRSCHRLMDPIGLAFEHFDGVGRLREQEAGRPIDGAGEIVGSPRSDGAFEGTAALGAHLAASPDVNDCFARMWLSFGYGLSASEDLACTLGQVQQALREGGQRFEDALLALVRAPHFRERSGPPPPPDEPPPEEPPPEEPPPPAGELRVDVITDSRWESGHCERVLVTNASDTEVAWRVRLDIEGRITQLWNALGSGDSGQVEFEGEAWNRVLAPLATASFGFCAAL